MDTPTPPTEAQEPAVHISDGEWRKLHRFTRLADRSKHAVQFRSGQFGRDEMVGTFDPPINVRARLTSGISESDVSITGYVISVEGLVMTQRGNDDDFKIDKITTVRQQL